ncbi:MAG: LysM peptidoglycan-binding domain-containing protein [Acidobacteriota bacterium]
MYKRPFVLLSGLALAMGCTLTLASVCLADGPPPRNLQKVGDHWTAWNPPVPPEGAEVYIIERGDTLWDLATRFYGDPYLWPQIWEQNQYILDAHWIYPGDPLVVTVEVTTADTLSEGLGEGAGGADDSFGEDVGDFLSADSAASAPGPLGGESDIDCTGFVGELNEQFPYRIIGSEFQALSPSLENLGGTAAASYKGLYGTDTVKVGMMNGDIIYLDGGRAGGMSPGQVYTAIGEGPKIRHPIDNKMFGRQYNYLGRVRVLSVQEDTAIAEVSHTCAPVVVGAQLKLHEVEPVPLGRRTRMRPVNLPPRPEELADAPVILAGDHNLITLGEDSVVFIDRGENADLVPGDIYTIYRLNRDNLPPVVLGEVAILSVHSRSSVGKILTSRYTVYPGDRLELK